MKSFGSTLDGLVGEFFRCFVKLADYLRAIGRIDAVELVAGLDAFAADDEWILAAELRFYLLNRRRASPARFLLC